LGYRGGDFMILADKIMCLRKQRGWSQEELAMRLDVSRQSVSKWESNQSIPDMNKVIQLSTLFNVTTDYLLKEELTEEHANLDEDELDMIKPRVIQDHEAREYLKVMKRESKVIARGVSLCILAAIMVVFFAGTSDMKTIIGSENIQVVVGMVGLFLFIAIAVAMFIFSSNRMEEYKYMENNVLSLEKRTKMEVQEKYNVFLKIHNVKITFAVVLLILGALPLIIGGILNLSEYTLVLLVVLLLSIALIGVHILVQVSLEMSGYKNLLNKGEYSKQSRQVKQNIESFESIYWTIVVAIYLGWSFYTGNWGFTWIIWPIAGVLSSIIPEIIKLRDKK